MATEDDEGARAEYIDDDEGAGGGRRRRRRLPHIPPNVLAFVGVLCAGVLIGWVVFRDEPAPGSETTTVAGEVVTTKERTYPKLGVRLGLPKEWKSSFRQSVLTLVSSDETVSVAISAAAGGGQGPKVRRSDRTELARLFKAREISRNRAKIGTATTIVTELIGQSRKGRPIRILSMGASSRWRTYSIQSFTVLAPTARRLAELRTLLSTVRFRQPQ